VRTGPEGLLDQEIVEALAAGWQLRVRDIEYAPVGFGSYHWWVVADERRWFVTADDLVRRRRFRGESNDEQRRRLAASLSTACSLNDAGLDFVVAPRPTRTGDVIHMVGERFPVGLYPHIVGETHPWSPYPSRAARSAVVDRLVAIHAVPVSTCPTALVDDLVVPDRDRLVEALGDLDRPWEAGPFAEPARALLAANTDSLIKMLGHYDELAVEVAGRADRMVVTHGEPHRGNTIDTADGVVLIDWDTALVAAPERDLWALADADPGVLDEYAARTGVTPDDDALSVYRLWWDLTMISVAIGRFREPHREDEDTLIRWNALNHYLDPVRWQATRSR
jgi:spectinomycin phosphotransferase/16S rRNA (guanine(1405)-N(7))-methyltransferase